MGTQRSYYVRAIISGVTVTLLTASLTLLTPASPVWAQSSSDSDTFVVNSTADKADITPSDEGCDADPDPDVVECTLRAAVQSANALGAVTTTDGSYIPDADVIKLPAGHYVLSLQPPDGSNSNDLTADDAAHGDLDIRGWTIIDGIPDASGSKPVVDAKGPADQAVGRVFQINASIESHGDFGRVEMDDIEIRNGTPPYSAGGGINNATSALVLTRVTFDRNSSGEGGGLYYSGVGLEIKDSVFVGNSGDAGGGLQLWTGKLNMDKTLFEGNTASSGGAITASNGNGDLAVITNSTIRNNTATSGMGGGIVAGAERNLRIENTTIEGNTALHGGGIAHDPRPGYSGRLEIVNSSVKNNTATSFGGGGLYGIIVADIRGSTFSGNRAAGSYNGGGAIFNANGKLAIENSTISGNSSDGDGGGIRNQSYASFGSPSKVSLDGVTLADNTADADTDGTGTGGNLYSGANDSDGTIATTAKNTILANAARGGDCAGSMVSGGHVLIEDAAGCEISGDTTGNIVGQDPKLGPLVDNGGPTATHLLASYSPAVDAGAGTMAFDQRGIARPQDGNGDGNSAPDIGALEKRPDETLDPTAPTVTATTPGGTGVKRNTLLTATFSEAMDDGTIDGSTFKLYKITSSETKQLTNVTVGLSSDGLKATLDPFGASATLLAKNAKYKAVVTTGAEDLEGNALDQSPSKAGNQKKAWTFTTGTS